MFTDYKYSKEDLSNVQKQIAQMYKQKLEEEEKIEKFITQISPVINKLNIEDISDPEKLRSKLKAIKNKKYQELIYELFRLSIDSAPQGAFITLNTNKILQLLKTKW